MMESSRARAILAACGAAGQDYHALPWSVVDALLVEADAYKYRKPKNANGSRARYWHAYLERRAGSLTGQAHEYVKNQGRSCTVTMRLGRRSVTVSTEDLRG